MLSKLLKSSVNGLFKAPALNHQSLQHTSLRRISLHEFQAGQLLTKYGLPVLLGEAAKTPEEAHQAALRIRDGALKAGRAKTAEEIDYVIKAQVLAGGRGMGYFKENNFQGGVHIQYTPDNVKEVATKMLGNTLITRQSGKQGKPCNIVYVVERVYMRKEQYISIMLDRNTGGPLIVCSSKGGMSIEEVDKKYIHTIPVDLKEGCTDAVATKVAQGLGLPDNLIKDGVKLVQNLYKAFMENDASLIEVNPLAVTNDGRLLICDCKVNVDDNAMFRQSEIQDDLSQKDAKEVEAAKYDLNYIALDGNIGCMVNGAGLAMATMDLIKNKGGEPANFLDVGGTASGESVVGAMKILNNDPQVEAILVNIFAGIVRCDIIAIGIIQAITEVGIKKPIVLRLKGTKIEEARKMIIDSGFNLFFTEDLEEAAERAVKMAQILRMAKEIKVNISLTS